MERISPPSATVMPLGVEVERGLRWSALSELVIGVVGTLSTLAYTRMLLPEDVGAFGLAMLVYTGLYLLVEIPIRDAVVYFHDREGEHESAAFWLLVGFTSGAVVLVLIFADVLAAFFASPVVGDLMRAVAVAFFVRALGVVPAASLLKRFRFAQREGLNIIYALILFAGWVTLAGFGFGPWSLVVPVLAASAYWALAMWVAARFRPLLRPGRPVFHEVVRFSRNLLGSKLVVYVKGYIDNAAVGTLGERALGWYSLGEDQSAFAVISVGTAIANVALPALARSRERLDEFQRIYLEMLRLAGTLSTPMQIGVIVLADLGVQVIFGDQWLGAVPVLRAYLAFRLVDALLVISNSATSALGRPDIQFKVDLVQIPFFVAGTLVGLYVFGGISSVAWCLAVVRLVAGLVYFAVVMKVTHLRITQVSHYLLPSSLAGISMGAMVYGLRFSGAVQGMTDQVGVAFWADFMQLGVFILCGVVLYVLLLFALDRSGFKAVVRMAWQVLFPESLRRRVESKLQGWVRGSA